MNDDIIRLLDRASNRVPALPAPLERILEDGRRKRRQRHAWMVGGVAAAVTAVIVGSAVALSGGIDRSPSPQPAGHTSTQPDQTAQAPACRSQDLGMTGGDSGTWQQLLSYSVTLTNTGDQVCHVDGADLRVVAQAATGDIDVDTARIQHQSATVEPGTAARVVFAMTPRPRHCRPDTPADMTLQVSVDASAVRTVVSAPGIGNAGCVVPTAVKLVDVAAPESATTSQQQTVTGTSSLDGRDQKVADAFVDFARTGENGPFDRPIELALGESVVKTLTAAEANDPAAWTVDMFGYAERGGTISALGLVRRADGMDLSYDRPLTCNGPGWVVQTPIGDTHHAISVKPADIDPQNGCFGWWQVILFTNDAGQVTAVDIQLDVP